MVCRHCKRELENRAPRGLCYTCYSIPRIRCMYQRLRNTESKDIGMSSSVGVGNSSFLPTDAKPGSSAKIKILCERAMMGLPLWHPNDRVTGCLIRGWG